MHRKMLDWEWYDDANTFRLFVHCLLIANHEDKMWRGQLIRRGQFISSRAKLSTALKISEQQIRTALAKLETTNEITSKGTPQHTVYTVNNYSKYQCINQQDNQRSTSKSTNDQPTNNQRVTTNNNETIKQINSPIAHARNSEGISKQPLPASAIPANPPSGFSVVEMTNDWEPDQQTIEHVTRGTGITRQEITSSLPAFRAHHLAANQTEFNFCKKLVSWCLRERQYEKNRSPPQAAASSNGITKAELDELYARHCGDQAT